MNYIFINKTSIGDKIKVIERAIDETKIVKELCIDDYSIKDIITLKSSNLNFLKNIINKTKIIKYERQLKKQISNLKSEDNDCYVFSNSINEDDSVKEYLSDVLNTLNISEYKYNGEFKNNIEKHIERYVAQNNKVLKDIKCLLVIKDVAKLDIKLVSRLINSYKTINIYSLNVPKKTDLNKINELNLKEGTTISIMNNTKKSYKEYDVAIYLDSLKAEFKKLRFNNLTLHLDINNQELDDFDSNHIKIKKLIKDNKLIETVMNRLYKNYGGNTVASIINKII